MRRWGYGLVGFFALAFIASVANPQSQQPELAEIEVVVSATPTQTTESAPEHSNQEQQSTSEPSQTPTVVPTASETSAPKPAPTNAPVAVEESKNRFEELLAGLTISDEYGEGYDRDLFRHWIDVDGDGCNARREVLIVEAIEAPTIGADCELIGGLWYSAYDGETTSDDGDFDIDHVVALKEAWGSGAYAWDANRRRAFANDLDLPQALIAVSAGSNRSKSDRDPADWLPPLSSYHCQYVEDWMVVKLKWELSVDPREFAALRSVAAGC